MVDNCRKSSPSIRHFILSIYWQHPVQDNQCPERAGHHRSFLSPSVKHLNTNTYKWNTPPVRHLNVNQYQCIIQVSIHTNQVIRRKNMAYPTGFGAYSSTCNQWDGQMFRNHGSQWTPTIHLYNSIYTVDELCVLTISHSVILSSLQ